MKLNEGQLIELSSDKLPVQFLKNKNLSLLWMYLRNGYPDILERIIKQINSFRNNLLM